MGFTTLSGSCGFNEKASCWILVNAFNLLKTRQINPQLTQRAGLVIMKALSPKEDENMKVLILIL